MNPSRSRRNAIVVACLLLASVASAQQQPEVDASKLFLFPGPRVIAPSGSRVTIDGANIVVEPGSTGITTLGTITAGTWNGVVIGCAYGGTAQSSYAVGDMLYASGAPCTLAKLAIGTSGYWLRSTGTAPAWTAPAELSRVNDTNVTLALGGSPTTALLNAAALTLGWTGTLAPVRGGSGLDTSASSGVPTINAGTWSINNVLTNTRVLFAGASNTISSDADITFDTDTLSATKVAMSSLTSGRVSFSAAAGLQVDDADLTFATDTLSATKVAMSSLTSGRVSFSTTAGLQVDDADLTFATDTLTSTKVTAPTWMVTPKIYAVDAAVDSLTLGGTTTGTCAGYPACEALEFKFDGTFMQQRTKTATANRTQWYAHPNGARLNSYNGGGWSPLWLEGAPVKIAGGGLQVGTNVISQPGLGNAIIDGYIGSAGYVSQLTGWRMTNTGALDTRYIYTDELHAKAFIADFEQALLGGQIICKSVAKVGQAFTAPVATGIATLVVKDIESAQDMAVFQSGDYIRIRSFARGDTSTTPDTAISLSITDAWGVVTSYVDLADGLQQWTFTRSAAPDAGAMAAGTIIAVDALVIDYGTSGNGCHEVNAIDGQNAVNSPYSQIFTWTTHPRNTTLRVRTGNQMGIWGVSNEYGIQIGPPTATAAYIRATTQAFTLNNVDMTMQDATNVKMRFVTSAPYFSMGSPAPTAFATGVGCWQGMDGGVFKWRCGDPAGAQYISWNGTQLTVSGNIVVIGTSIDASSVGGVAAATINSGVDRAMLGLLANGNPSIPVAVAPSGAGLYLGASHLGYYNGSAWRTYLDSSGNFYLGGTSGALQWNGTTLSISGNITVTGGNAATTAYVDTAEADAISSATGTAATDATTKANAAQTAAISSSNGYTNTQVATRIATGGAAADVRATNAAPSGSGLFLGADYMGYYASGAWQTYMTNTGNFYLGGASGALQWNGTTLSISGNITVTGGNAATQTYANSAASTAEANANNFTNTGATISGGAISGMNIGADYIRDAANTFGISSTVTGGDDVRFWAGTTFADRANAPFRITESGVFKAGGTVTINPTGGIISATELRANTFDATTSLSLKLSGVEQWLFMQTTASIFTSAGTSAIGLTYSSTASGLTLNPRALGTGATVGPTLRIGENSSGNGAAGTLALTTKGASGSGVVNHIWVDDTGGGSFVGQLRIGLSQPEEDDNPSDTGGTVVGTQSSQRSTKNIYSAFTDYTGALREILQTPLWNFRYKTCAYNCQDFIGITTDDSPLFGMDAGRSFNPVTAFGVTVASIKALHAELEALRDEVRHLKDSKEKQ